ncbi:MAG: methyl-accepting chemotaxis protein [Nitrospirota bacterium]|nr:methyl-accepting chemotaxis protein [Nitrospirota bacterium]
MNMSFRKIIYLGVSLVVAVIIVAGGLSAYHAREDSATSRALAAHIELGRVVAEANRKAQQINSQLAAMAVVADPRLEKAMHEGLLKTEEEMLHTVEQMQNLPGLDAEEQKAVATFKTTWSSYRDIREKVILAGVQKGQGQIIVAGAAFDDAMQNLNILQQLSAARAKAHLDHAFIAHSAFLNSWGGIAFAMVLLCIFVAVFLGRRVSSNLEDIVAAAESMAKGDLSRRVSHQGDEDFRRLEIALNKMADNFEKLLQEVTERSYDVSLGAKQLYQANDSFASTLTVQTAMVEETTATMDEMADAIRQNADSAKNANRLMSQARQSAEDGGRVMGNAFAAMKEISTSSRMIADIIGVIDDIAFQTNLLALNAAVEAARAGEHGRGFAVVAQEVRNLSQRSAKAAKEVSALIQENLKKTENGSLLADQSLATLREIVDNVKQMAELMSEISAASQEQAHGAEQVQQAVVQLDQVTQQNAALHQETSAAASDMAELAQHLCTLVRSFKVSPGSNDLIETSVSDKGISSSADTVPTVQSKIVEVPDTGVISGKVTPLHRPAKKAAQGRGGSFEPLQREDDEF